MAGTQQLPASMPASHCCAPKAGHGRFTQQQGVQRRRPMLEKRCASFTGSSCGVSGLAPSSSSRLAASRGGLPSTSGTLSSRGDVQTRAASTPSADVQESSASDSKPGRKLAVAVDSKQGSVHAVEWVLANVAREGDVIHLVHVINNPRTPSTAVGGTTSSVQWSPPPDMPQLTKEWTQRIEEAGRTLVMEKYVPLVRSAGYAYEVEIVKQRGATSAAGIGEVICGKVGKIKAEIMFIASLGAGVLADFGSVAQYCAKHAPVPVVLLPPKVLDGSAVASSSPAAASGSGVMVAAIDDLAGLEQATRFAANNLYRGSEALWAVSVQNSEGGAEVCEEGDSVCEDSESETRLHGSVTGWAKGLVGPGEVQIKALLNVSNTEVDSEHSLVGEQLVQVSDESGVRCVVLADSNKNNMLREIMYGNITNFFLRHCKVPVVVLP